MQLTGRKKAVYTALRTIYAFLPALVLGGTAGGMAGPRIPARTGDRQIGRLLIGLPFVTAAISLYNFPSFKRDDMGSFCRVKSLRSNVTHRENYMKTRGYAPGFHIATAKRLAAMILTALGSYLSGTAKRTI